ncbi:YkgJ family cysteine cluster protein, partial [Candidatus Sumerlaeota bacterium]|nr:YkgJ family cysteine cluster protein [Candidatus Sumerlaeota bacterium]
MQKTSLKIGKASEFFGNLKKEDFERFQEQFTPIERPLDPNDTFRFECDKSGICCKNRFNGSIILTPYDVARLRKRLGLTSSQFIRQHAEMILGAESELPMALLRYDYVSDRKNKCPFIRSYGCRVYEDRPLRCRLYPVGRATDLEGTSYFFLIKTGSQCGVGKGREYTLQEWIEESKAGDHLLWSDNYNMLFNGIDHKKYKQLDKKTKTIFSFMLYDFDALLDDMIDKGLKYIPR